MYGLHFELVTRPHPYRDEAAADVELWGRCRGVMNLPEPVHLFTVEWDLALFAEWLADSYAALGEDVAADAEGGPLVDEGESLADALARAQRRDDFGDDQAAEEAWFDRLHRFRVHHSLTFAFRGARIPPIVIGRNGENGDVSLAAEWHHRYDFDHFMADLLQRTHTLLADWDPVDERGVRRRAETLARLPRPAR